jgi:class 3 adenylate cyclase
VQATAELRADAKTASDQISQLSQANASLSGSAAERRQLRVMFCDVIDFTALSSRIDPEDLSAVIRGYQSRVAMTIARFGGFVARYAGDGILIYFGCPEAHEANAESAVRAAFAVVDAIARTPVMMLQLQFASGSPPGWWL